MNLRPKRLAPDARAAVIRGAYEEARRRADTHITSEHLLLAVVADADGARLVGVDEAGLRDGQRRYDTQALESIGLAFDVERTRADEDAGRRHRPRRRMRMSHGATQVLVRALRAAETTGEATITVRHLTLGIVGAEPPDPAVLLLQFLDVDVDDLRRSLPAVDIAAD